MGEQGLRGQSPLQAAAFAPCLSLPTSTVTDEVRPWSFSAGVLRLPEAETEEAGKGGSLTPAWEGSEGHVGSGGGPWGTVPKLKKTSRTHTFSLDFTLKM